MEDLASCLIDIHTQKGAAYRWSNRYMLLTEAAVSWLARFAMHVAVRTLSSEHQVGARWLCDTVHRSHDVNNAVSTSC